MGKTAALYPGTFDCLTFGHIDLIERCARVFDHLVVGVAVNSAKKPIFTKDERIEMLRTATRGLANVEVAQLTGLTVAYARDHGIPFMIRGLRAVTDFESELQMALMNQRIAPEVETVFMAPSIVHAFISSSLTKEIVAQGGDVSTIVPDYVAVRMRERLSSTTGSAGGDGEA